VKATARDGLKGPWLSKLNTLHSAHEDINQLPLSERDRVFVELNILDQIHSLRKLPEVANAGIRGRLHIHGIVYDSETEKAYRLSEGQQNN
jgi:carbonic anhydrase